jgi:phosphoribosylformimino-5-aminoimidazole carboxamide ribotide isomerase
VNIIPALDLIDGKCVRLSQGDFGRKTEYDHAPLDMAKRFEDAGITRLHMVDLDGARVGEPQNLKVLEDVASKTRLIIDFSGGLRSEETVRNAFNAGSHMVLIGSAAVKQPDDVKKWLRIFGPEKFILGADVKGEKLAISGWQEKTTINIQDFISQWSGEKVSAFLCTSITRDGLLDGPDLALYTLLTDMFPKQSILASGGITTVIDLKHLKALGVAGAVMGKTIYEGRIALSDLNTFLC